MKPFCVKILRFDSLDSTNTEAARQAAQGANEGLCIVAAEQTAGRGRLQRHWASPKDAGLYCSVLLKPEIDQKSWPLVALAAGLAVSEALRKSCALETDIKWPNDILAGERKLCGILAETIETPFARALIVGIGINLTKNAFPKELEQKATSIESEIGKLPDTETVLHTLIDSFAKHYQILQQPRGEKEIVDHWCKHSSYAQGKRIQVTDGSETFAGITRGLESDGALRVETDAGETKTFHAGDVMAVRSG